MKRLGLLTLLLIGCVVPKAAEFPDVKQLLESRGLPRVHWNQGGDADRQVEERIVELLKRPLTLASATEIGLLNNPKLQATYERLGVAQADLVQAGLLRNPSLSLGLGLPLPGTTVAYEFEASLVQDFLDLFMIPLRKRFARIEFDSVKLEVADAVIEHAADVRKQFYTVQAQQQIVAMRRIVSSTAQAAVELRQRQFEAGNVAEVDLVVEKNAYAEAKLQLYRAEVQLRVDRETFDRELGLWGGRVSWTIDAPLADLPSDEWPLEHVESFAMQHRLDLQAARTRLTSFVSAIKLTNAGMIGGLEAGVSAHQDPDSGSRLLGPSLRLELPIFDQRQGTRAKLRAQLRAAQHSLDAMAIRVRTEVRTLRDRLAGSREIVEFFKQTALPLREREIAVTQLQYNAMQVGLFSLLTAKERQINAYREYIESVRDYWMARADLERAAGGPLIISAPEKTAANTGAHK